MMPAEMPTQRAFTYLKIRGGDLDRIREHPARPPRGPRDAPPHGRLGRLRRPRVRRQPRTKKRQVLDFVTERIRGIPEVLDTSTLVPEYSVTKFPF